MKYNKTMIALALASTLSACGSDNSAPVIEPPPPPPVETTVTGQAVKGVLANAVVTVYKFVDGEPVALDPATELKDGEITTDGSGNYSFIVLDYEGPIKVELSPSTDPENPTTMICDAPTGCGDTAFGDAIDLTVADPDFTLAAISVVDSESAGEVKVNVSALTHLASELIEADEGGVTADTVTEQSTLIASTFGIEGDITQLEATVTTDAAAVAGEDNEEELRLGLINAGIMEAMFSGETDDAAVLSTKLSEVAADLIENDGALLVNQDEEAEGFELAISDVLEGAGDAAAAAVELIVADESLTGTEEILGDLAQEEVNLENEQAYQEANVGDDGLGEVVIDEPTEGDAVAKAKAMVNDVRLFTHLFDETTTEGADIRQGTKYTDLMDAASLMITTEADTFTLLAQISNALAQITLELDSGELASAAGGVAIANYLTPDEITGVIGDATGTITFNENTTTGGVLFTVNASAKGGAETATLNASAEFAADGLSIMVSLDGSIESAEATFTLADTSLAKISFDSVASRDAFDNDTYEGEITSGELQLDVELAQKTSDTVTNPITFTGTLHTKLLPIGEPVLDERWDWDDTSQEPIINYGRPEIDTLPLPEMLTLSGEFTSLEADSISATLTVGINNLAGYEAPEFKYIGKEIMDVFAFTISDDLNTITSTASTQIEDGFNVNRVFTPGATIGNWSYTETFIPLDVLTHPWGESFIKTTISSTFTVGSLDKQGIIYGRSFVVESDETNFFAMSVKITPVDTNADNITDHFEVRFVNTNDRSETIAYSSSAIFTDKGELKFAGGEIKAFTDSPINNGLFSVEDVANNSPWFMPASPLEVSTATQLHASTLENHFYNEIPVTIKDEGHATLYFYEDELEALLAGDASGLPTSAYLIQPLIKDAATVEVSADGTVAVSLGNSSTLRTFAFTGEGDSFGNFEALAVNTEDDYSYEIKEWSETNNDAGLDIDEVIYSKSIDEWQWHYQVKITPIDDDQDNVTDRFSVSFAEGDHFDINGILINQDGTETVFNNPWWEFISYDDENWGQDFYWALSFNPLTASNALDIYKGQIVNNWDYSATGYADGIGRLEVNFSAEDIDSIVVPSTTMFDAYNTEADSRDSLEDETTFLDVNVALSLEAILGDYQVQVQFSGDRTALEAGAFDLAMSYRLPGEDAQRSFTAHYNTEEEGRLTANNFEGVVLVLNEPDESIIGTQILGHILVGPTAIVAATIEDRGNGLVVIVYSDETTETL